MTEAIDNLQPLFKSDCTRQRALKCWDKVFATTFFSERYEAEQREAAAAAPAIVSSTTLMGRELDTAGAVRKEGGGRHA